MLFIHCLNMSNSGIYCKKQLNVSAPVLPVSAMACLILDTIELIGVDPSSFSVAASVLVNVELPHHPVRRASASLYIWICRDDSSAIVLLLA